MSTDKSLHEDSPKAIVKSTSIISAGTLSSRILGFIRDIVLAKIFGTGLAADAFFVALKVPNLFRDLIGEGATNSAIVPVFAERLAQEKRENFWRFVSVILVWAMIVLSIITLLGIALAPVLVRLIAPGFIADPQKLALTISLTKLMFPYLIFIGLTAYSIAILYTFRSFTVPAFSPCLLNISLIISALWASHAMDEPVYGLAAGVIVGGLLQLLVQIPPLAKIGMVFYRPQTLKHPGARKVGKLLIPRLFGAGVYQMTVLVDTFCASLSFIVGVGGISAIYYANRIIQFPMGVFGFAISSAVLPALAGFATSDNIEQLKKTLMFALKNIFFVMVPVSILIFILSNPIIRILFQRGAFDAYSTNITSSALFFYSIGLFSFGGIKVMVTAFHALQDTKTPVKVAAACLGVNAMLNFVLMFPFKIGGIALASAIAGTIDFIVLYRIMDRRLNGLDGQIRVFLTKIVSASLWMGVFVMGIWRVTSGSNEILQLALACLSGMFIYGALCYMLRVEQARNIFKWLKEVLSGKAE